MVGGDGKGDGPFFWDAFGLNIFHFTIKNH